MPPETKQILAQLLDLGQIIWDEHYGYCLRIMHDDPIKNWQFVYCVILSSNPDVRENYQGHLIAVPTDELVNLTPLTMKQFLP